MPYNKLIGQKHGLVKHKLYYSWASMKTRCYNSNCVCYKDYGGRGIKVCDEWKNSFINFYNWSIKNGYLAGLQIDRIDNNSHYEPNNCRWITPILNLNNKRNNHVLTFNNKTQTLSQWAIELNIPRSTLTSRLKHGWSTEETLTLPRNKYDRKNS